MSARFSPDGKTILTGSEDNTARLWACEECRPIDEIATDLAARVGISLTPEQRRQYGIPDNLP